MVVYGYMMEKALDKASYLIKLGFRKLDTEQSFLIAYENSLASYKSEYGEDDLYNKFFKEDKIYYCDQIKEIIDNTSSTRELESNLATEMGNILPNVSPGIINVFITQLFTELLLTEEYRNKIIEYRQDSEISKIYKLLLELKQNYEGSQRIKYEFENNMFQYYLDKWNSELFLHKNPDNKICLKDIYMLPFYKERNSSLKEKIRTDLEVKIDSFLGDSTIGNRRKPMLILADAGMGKSSLVSYICSKCPQNNNVIVLKFADLTTSSLENNILASVLDELNCKIEDLKDKRLIIDGFDESEFTTDKNRLLSNFFYNCQNITGLKVLVTSRVNYVDCKKFTNCKLYYVQFMNEEQIDTMSRAYFTTSKELPFRISNGSNNEIIGVPLILYMIMSLKIHVEEDVGICELYEKIFAFDGGIYDRMTMEDTDGYSEGVHRIAFYDPKKEVHLISQLIAFAMFENESLLLSSDKYMDIVKGVSKDRMEDFAISNYYYIESSSNTLSFCHKSIFEYFVAEYIFNTISSCKEVDKIAEKIAYLSKKSLFNQEILRFLRYKIEKKSYNNEDIYMIFESVVNQMIQNGMTYYLEKNIADILKTESLIFRNIFELLDLFYIRAPNIKLKSINVTTQFLSQLNNRVDYTLNLKNCLLQDLNLDNKNYFTNLDVSDSELKGSSFNNTNIHNTSFKSSKIVNVTMRQAYLRECSFASSTVENFDGQETTFESCDFTNVVISKSDFSKADLSFADFSNAILSDINFDQSVLHRINFRGADLTGLKLHSTDLISCSINESSILDYASVDISVAPKIISCTKNIKGLKIYDAKERKKMSLEEYKKIYGIQKR